MKRMRPSAMLGVTAQQDAIIVTNSSGDAHAVRISLLALVDVAVNVDVIDLRRRHQTHSAAGALP